MVISPIANQPGRSRGGLSVCCGLSQRKRAERGEKHGSQEGGARRQLIISPYGNEPPPAKLWLNDVIDGSWSLEWPPPHV